MQSSLHTIRPMATPIEEDMVEVPPAAQVRPPAEMSFPFRANTIARRARSPGQSELQYQFAHMSMTEKQEAERRASLEGQDYFNRQDAEEPSSRRSSTETVSTDGGVSMGAPARQMMSDRMRKEEHLGEQEEAEEMVKASSSPETELAPIVESGRESPAEANVSAALREGSSDEELIEDRMLDNPAEKKRVRREQLAERLQEVFGLAEREDVLDEMRCWLLRSVSE